MEQARRNFVVEGMLEIGPRADFFTFLNGEMLGRLIAQHSGVKRVRGEYTRLGRARISVEWLDEEAPSPDA